MTKKLRDSLVFVSAALILLPATAGAFGLSGLGFKVGYLGPEDSDATAVGSAHLEFEQPGSRFHLLPNVQFWSNDLLTDVNPNFDLYYHFVSEGEVTPYVGGGIGLHFLDVDVPGVDSETDVGGNLMGGLRFPARNMHFFMEGRYTISDVNQGSLQGGMTFHL
jgi:hypothetical protein